jgi:hypothetical protein
MFTNVSKVCTAAIIRALIIIAMIMEVASTSETSENAYQSTQRHNPEDSKLHNKTFGSANFSLNTTG